MANKKIYIIMRQNNIQVVAIDKLNRILEYNTKMYEIKNVSDGKI